MIPACAAYLLTGGFCCRSRLKRNDSILRPGFMPESSRNKVPASIYLDHAAASPMLRCVIEGHAERCARYGYNPHSTHQVSEDCMLAIERAESEILACLSLSTRDVALIWTSGGTESNNLGILGCLRDQPAGICAVEASAHSSVLEPARRYGRPDCGGRCIEIPVAGDGQIELDAILPELGDGNLRMVALCQVNNETGVVQNLTAARQWLDVHAPGAYLLVDALQSFGKIEIPWREAGIDLLAIGGRKIGGPPHAGALAVRKGTPLQPLLFGGGQQNGLRPGTLDTIGIVEFALAARFMREGMARNHAHAAHLNALLRHELAHLGNDSGVEIRMITPDNASPHILSFACVGFEGALLMRLLAERGAIVGTGSACSAESGAVSHVLRAMGLPRAASRAALRVSLGPDTTEAEIRECVQCLRQVLRDY